MSTSNITHPPTGMPEYHPNHGRSGAIAAGDAATKQQMALIGNPTSGGKRRGSKRRGSKRRGSKRRGSKHRGSKRRGSKRRIKRGGAVTVTPIQIPYSDNGATTSNLKAITASSAQSTANSSFDKCVGQGPGCTAAVEAGQQAGGRNPRTTNKRRLRKKKTHRRKVGGKSITWGCMSGGRTRRHN